MTAKQANIVQWLWRFDVDTDDFVVLGTGNTKIDYRIRIGRAKSRAAKAGEPAVQKMNVVVDGDLWKEFSKLYNSECVELVQVAYSQKQETLRVVADAAGYTPVRMRGQNLKPKSGRPAKTVFVLQVVVPPGVEFKDADRLGAQYELDDGKLYITMPRGCMVGRDKPSTPTVAERAVSDGGSLFRKNIPVLPRAGGQSATPALMGDPPPGRSALDQKVKR
jgi:hypothetical protein